MALSALRAERPRRGDDAPTLTKNGFYIYDGKPSGFHEWEFRTMSKYDGCKDEDKPFLASKVLEGLVEDAFTVAMDFGREELKKADGVVKLVETMRAAIFPLKEAEAKELYHQGQLKDGPMSRQSGESMMQTQEMVENA